MNGVSRRYTLIGYSPRFGGRKRQTVQRYVEISMFRTANRPHRCKITVYRADPRAGARSGHSGTSIIPHA